MIRRSVEMIAFTGLALGLHVALLSGGRDDGVEAGGGGGESLVTLIGAPAQAAAALRKWTRPPAHHSQVTPMRAPSELSENPPDTPILTRDSAPLAQLSIPALAMMPPVQSPKVATAAATPTPPPQKPAAKPPAKPEPEAKRVAKPEARSKPRLQSQSQAKRNVKPSAGSISQNAAGRGGSAHAGNNGPAQVSTLSKGKKISLRRAWGGKIRARIARQKRQPGDARGPAKVVLVVVVSRSGRLMSLRVGRSSGKAAFDRAALTAVKRAGRFPKAPQGLNNASYTFSLPLKFDR